MSVFNFGVEDATIGLIATVVASIFVYIVLMFEVDFKEWDWLEFKFKKFGMESNGFGYLHYSEDRQDWGITVWNEYAILFTINGIYNYMLKIQKFHI